MDNRLPWVRDVTFEEDCSQVRTGNRPRVMASLPSLAITALRLSGVTNVATAFATTLARSGRKVGSPPVRRMLRVPSRRTPMLASRTSSSAVSNSLRGGQGSLSAGMQ